MRIQSLSVEHFRCIRAARMSFGPGLNVLYGPNDLGKSSLAEALRAALLLPSGSTEHKTFVPAGTDQVPKIVVEFEIAEGAGVWRVTKTFGVGTRATATLETAKGAAKWHTDARGRDVDGRLRDLLSWGIPAPGGKGGPRGMAQTFLTTALLGRQGEVDAILTASIEKDPDPSGQQIVTQALNVLGQHPLVRRLLTRLEDKTKEVFDNRGRQRSAVDSPLVRAKHEIEGREGRIRELEEAARRSDEVQRVIREHIRERDRIAADRDTAVARLGEVRRGLELGDQRRAAERVVATAEAEFERALAAHRSVADAGRVLAESEAALTGASERSRVADEALSALDLDSRKTRDALERARAVHGSTRSEAEHAHEKWTSDQQIELAAARGRAAAAREARTLEERANSLRSELADAEALFEDAKKRVTQADALLRLAGIRDEHRKAVEALDALQEAEVQREARKNAFDVAASAVGAADAVVLAAQRRIEEAREMVGHRLAEDAARDARRQVLTTSLMQVESSERDARASADRARAALQREERVGKLEQSFGAATAEADATERQLAESSAAVELTEQELRELSGLVLWLRVEDLARKRQGLDVGTRAASLRARASDARTRAGEINSSPSVLPAVERLAAIRAMDERKRNLRLSAQSEPASASPGSAIAVGLSAGLGVTLFLRAITTFHGLAISMGGLLAAVLTGALHLALRRRRGASAASETRSAEEAERAYVSRRWAEEVEPLLRAAGVADVDALERRSREAEERRVAATGLNEDAQQLEAQAKLAERDGETVVTLQREEAGLRNQLVDFDLDALAARATSLQSAGADTADAMIRDAERALAAQKKPREQLLDRRSRATIQLESARAFLEAAREERDLHALGLGAEPRVALDDAERRIRGAHAEAEELRKQIASLGSPVADVSPPASLTKAAEDALAVAIEDLKIKSAVRDKTARELVESETRHELCVRDAAVRDIPSLERLVAAARQMLSGEDVDGGDPSDALLVLDQRKMEAEGAGTRLAGLGARCDEASRTFAQAQGAFAGGWAIALTEAETTIANVQADLEAGLTAPQEQVDATVRDLAVAEALYAEAEQRIAPAQALTTELAAKRDLDRTSRDRAKGQLEERERLASTIDTAGAELALAGARRAMGLLPDAPSVELMNVDAFQAAADALEKELRRIEDELREARGKLGVVGGAIAQEALREEREALERLTEKTEELEVEYAASRLLRDTLKEVEAKHAAHLGASLAKPVTERFTELTQGRYAQVVLDPSLRARGVMANNDERAPEALSVGTREQLATLVRLALAAQLGTVVLLDDQLVQSDSLRLEWFRQRLRASVRDHGHQILVFTCRTEDYLTKDELPVPGEAQRETDGGSLMVANLERVIIRGGSHGASSRAPAGAP